MLMRSLTYDTYEPTPLTWCYKPHEELLSDTLTGLNADVYAWASTVYEVRTLVYFDTIISTCILKVFSASSLITAFITVAASSRLSMMPAQHQLLCPLAPADVH